MPDGVETPCMTAQHTLTLDARLVASEDGCGKEFGRITKERDQFE
jgi:hypothetical protein